jgi:ketosteroid isomerase-like protein
MSTTNQHQDTLAAQLGVLAAAMAAQNIDGLMAHYDDGLVFVENGQQRDKAGLRAYVQELWAGDAGFSVDVATMHAIDDVLAVTLEASTGAETEAGEKVRISWPMFVTYQFDLDTLKVVREVAFSDEAAVAAKLAAAGIA